MHQMMQRRLQSYLFFRGHHVGEVRLFGVRASAFPIKPPASQPMHHRCLLLILPYRSNVHARTTQDCGQGTYV